MSALEFLSFRLKFLYLFKIPHLNYYVCFCSPHSDVSSSDGDLGADGIHGYHCECGRDEMHEGGRQQPIHQEQDRHLWWESVPALR